MYTVRGQHVYGMRLECAMVDICRFDKSKTKASRGRGVIVLDLDAFWVKIVGNASESRKALPSRTKPSSFGSLKTRPDPT